MFVNTTRRSTKTVIKTTVKKSRKRFRFYVPTCHYCHKYGYFKPECYHFYCDQMQEKYAMKCIGPFKMLTLRTSDQVKGISPLAMV